MDETMNAVNETAISQEPETQQEIPEVQEPDTQPQVQGNGDGVTAQGIDGNTNEEQPDEKFLEIKYFGENINLSRAEAKNFAEIGKRYSDVRDTLERVATLKGLSVEDFLKNLETAEDEAYRQSLIEKFGNDEDLISGMMELHEIKKQKTLDSAAENRRLAAEAREQSTTKRIADEFSKMKKDFPELTDYSALPQAVKQAASEGMPLAYAYLMHQHTEKQKVDTAKNQAAAAEKMSAGSMSSAEAIDMVGDAFLKGILGK